MEEYVKLGQAGRRLVREGVFEVRMPPGGHDGVGEDVMRQRRTSVS